MSLQRVQQNDVYKENEFTNNEGTLCKSKTAVMFKPATDNINEQTNIKSSVNLSEAQKQLLEDCTNPDNVGAFKEKFIMPFVEFVEHSKDEALASMPEKDILNAYKMLIDKLI